METPNFATGAADPRFATEDPVLPEYRRVDAECGEWPADHKDALYKCGQLDVSFAALLPAANDANVNSSSIDKDEIILRAQLMADSAKAMYTYFETLRTKVPRNKADALRKEIAELEQELSNQAELLSSSQERVKEWKQRLQKLRDTHEKLQAMI